MSETTLPAVARRFLYDCKKCDAERFHIVLAHMDSSSAKVQCEVCQSRKTYRLPKTTVVRASIKSTAVGAQRRAQGARGGQESKLSSSHRRNYEEYEGRLGSASASDYRTSSMYTSEAVIRHPKFGIGYVMEASSDRIHVLFVDEVKVLIHNRH